MAQVEKDQSCDGSGHVTADSEVILERPVNRAFEKLRFAFRPSGQGPSRRARTHCPGKEPKCHSPNETQQSKGIS
jgi:hypothetical protein